MPAAREARLTNARDAELAELAQLLREKLAIDRRITRLIGDRPALIGHLGEYVAAHVFDITLHESASHKGSDGWFRTGALAGKSVNIKWYAQDEGVIDVAVDAGPDLYLVLTGPLGTLSRGARPWSIEAAYLFSASHLVRALRERGVQIGVATSVRRELWSGAEIHPRDANALLRLEPRQHGLLSLFAAVKGP